jgi:phage terminase small subunit
MAGKLTDKQEQFCREYLIDLNATQACIRAGYSERTARQIGEQNLSKLDIQERIAELKAVRAEKNEIDADWVLKSLKEIQERCLQAEPVKDKEGKPTGEYKFDATNAIKATELIGKHIGFFEKDNQQKATNTLNEPLTVVIKDMSNARDSSQ